MGASDWIFLIALTSICLIGAHAIVAVIFASERADRDQVRRLGG